MGHKQTYIRPKLKVFSKEALVGKENLQITQKNPQITQKRRVWQKRGKTTTKNIEALYERLKILIGSYLQVFHEIIVKGDKRAIIVLRKILIYVLSNVPPLGPRKPKLLTLSGDLQSILRTSLVAAVRERSQLSRLEV